MPAAPDSVAGPRPPGAGGSGPVVLLSGGTGGAKLARGLLDVVGADLVVVANTGDDVVAHAAHVSPDPDLVLWWLADRIDARGWGVAGDSFGVMQALRELGEDVWFELGDFDLAACLQRTQRLAAGARLTEALDSLRTALGVPARVLPMSDAPVRTWVRARGRRLGLQEFLIRERGAGPVDDVGYDGTEDAQPTPEVLAALASARAIVVGPSNPVISIGPILALPGLRAALRAAPAPVVAVSPLVRGRVLKGPTAAFLAWAGLPLSSDGVAEWYGDAIDALLADEPAARVPTRVADVGLGDPASRRRVARAVLALAADVAAGRRGAGGGQ